jgi:hypothetical protein
LRSLALIPKSLILLLCSSKATSTIVCTIISRCLKLARITFRLRLGIGSRNLHSCGSQTRCCLLLKISKYPPLAAHASFFLSPQLHMKPKIPFLFLLSVALYILRLLTISTLFWLHRCSFIFNRHVETRICSEVNACYHLPQSAG